MNPKSGSTEETVVYSFGVYALDTKSRTVRNGERIVELTPKQFQTLLVLVENHDRIMSKEELLKNIWPEQFVEESNVIQNVCVLRKALGETIQGKKFIETFPGRGYRFSESVATVRDSRCANGTAGSASELPVHKIPAGECSSLDSQPPLLTVKSAVPIYRRYGIIATLCLIAAAIASAFVFNRSHAPPKQAPAIPPIQLRTLVRMNGTQSEPSWSLDGQSIAFVYSSPTGTGSEIYTQSASDIRPKRIADGSWKYSSPVWSPDGKYLAYLRIGSNKAEISIFNLSISTERTLTTLFPHRYQLTCRHLDWSPDGAFLVVDDKAVESDPLTLFLISVSNGRKIRLTYPDTDIIGDVAPRFSPDGSQVAFIRMKYRVQNDVFVVPITGGEQRKLTEEPSRMGDVDWDSNHSLIFSSQSNDQFRFWRLNLQSPKPQPTLALPIGTDMPPEFSISRRSHQAVMSAYQPDLNIWSVDLSKAHPSQADWTRIIQTPGQDVSPSVSPDGEKIMYRSDVSGKMQIWVCNADGSGAFQVYTGSIIPEVDSWAPDSKSIVFSSRGHLYEVEASRKPLVRRIESPPISHPTYSVDGKWIFARRNYFIYRLPATGGNLEQISDQGGAPIAQSTDGRFLYFGHGRMDPTLTQLDLTTRQQKVIISSLMPGFRASWALTPRGIIFLTERSGRPVIAFHDFATGKEREVTEFFGALPPFSISGFSVSPDGKHLLVVRADPAFANLQTTTFN
jgi:Tol biopolymer transport system component/DNA-binding winged helix-turn-helix (wHTH) protein